MAGEHLTYEVVVHNDGPDEANGAVLTVTLPAGVTFVSGGTLFGLGPPCSAASGVDDTTVVTCPFDIVPAGSNTYAEIVVIPDAAGVLTTQASVTSGAGDPVAGNNTATASTLVDGLLFPLQGREPDTAIINAVLDHSSTLPYAKDGRIELASGEVASCDVGARKYSAVAKKTGVPAGTIVAVPAGGCGDLRDGKVGSNGWLYEYQVAGSEEWVSYDGHPGYDFKAAAGEPILATTGGTLCVATSDTVPPAPNEQKVWRHPAKCPFGDDPINAKGKNAWKEWHVFYIIPEGGGSSSLTTWYLHADDFSDGVRAAVRSQGFAEVAEGAEVAWVGGCCKNLGPHLHFEVREGNDTGVDPYGWKGSPVLWK